MPSMRVLIYARLSSSSDNSTSIERQLKVCRELAEQRGWSVAGEYVDDGVSGAVAPEDRPAMSKLLQQFPDIDAMVAWKLDRVSRSLLDFSRLLEVAERDGVDIVSCTEQLDTTTAMGRAFAQLVALFAEMERSMIRERIMQARQHLKKTHRHTEGRAPYGLRIVPAPDGRGKVLERDPEAVEVLREIISRLISGEPRNKISRDLNERGVTTPRVRTSLKPNPKLSYWSGQGIQAIIKHPSLLGHRLDERGHVIRNVDGTETVFWEPVTDRETLTAARLAIEARSFDRVAPARRHWLFGIAVCGKCGRPLTQSTRKPYPKSPNAEPVMRCYGRNGDRCGGVMITIRKITSFISDEFLTTVGHMDAYETVFVPGNDTEAELEALNRSIANLRDDRDAGLFDDDPEDYRQRMTALTSRRRALRNQPSMPPRWEQRPLGLTVAELWEKSDDEERGQLIKGMNLRCVVHSAQRRRNITTAERAELVPVEVWERIVNAVPEGAE